MARPRGQSHRPSYSFEAIGVSRASGLVVKSLRWPSKRPGAQVWGQKPGQLEGHWYRAPARIGAGEQSGVSFGGKMMVCNAQVGWAPWLKKVAAGACACALALGLSGCALTTPSIAEVERPRVEAKLGAADLVNEGVLTVAMDTTDAPQAMTDADGLAAGYYADIARALAERMGLDLAIVSTANADGALADREADMYIGMKTADADDTIEVSDSIMENASSIFTIVEKGSSISTSLDAAALSGVVIAVQSGSAAQDALVRGGINATLKTCANVNECFEALAAGQASYVACDATAGAYLARAYPDATFVATIGDVTTYGVGVLEASTAVAEEAENALTALANEGVLDTIFRSWYGSLPMSLSSMRLQGLSDGNVTDEDAVEEPADQGESDQFTIEGDINSMG
jgi:ABC-type amino acid transport substrate-binding protein